MPTDPALTTYRAFAPIYDRFNSANDYEMWLGRGLLPELSKHGLREGGRALDVGCGTGRAFEPLISRGWQVVGCDQSPTMLEIAAANWSDEVELRVADMRKLGRLGAFDLVLALNDTVNYLLGDQDLRVALAAMRANLASRGLLIFDVNSSSTYTSGVGKIREVQSGDARWTWTNEGEVAPSVYEAQIAGDELSAPIRHLERFRSEAEVRDAMGAAGVDVVAVLGMSESGGEVLLTSPADDARDYKVVFIGSSSASFRHGIA